MVVKYRFMNKLLEVLGDVIALPSILTEGKIRLKHMAK